MLIAGSSVDILSSTKRNESNSRILKKFVSLVLQLVLIILQHQGEIKRQTSNLKNNLLTII